MIDFVSVLIPVYNAERYLARALDSVLAQSHINFELLIINDGSTDKSASIVDAYALQDNRIRTIHQSNTGKAAALNRLVKAAKSDWCVFMDNDDIMMPDRLEKQIRFHNENPDVMASSSHCQYIDENDKYSGSQTFNGLQSRQDSTDAFENNTIVIAAWTALMANRNLYIEVGGLRNEFWPAEDMDFINRWIEQGHYLIIVQDYFMKYRVHSEAMTVKSKFDFLKRDYCYYCKNLRVKGLPEITFAEFEKNESKMSFFKRIQKKLHTISIYYHKAAGFSYHQKKMPAFIFQIIVASVCDYRYVYASYKSQQAKGSIGR